MTKYYVQSGKIRKVIFAADENAAALWLINIVMERFYPNQKPASEDIDPFAFLEDGLTLLGDDVFVSKADNQPGDSQNGWRFETVDLFTEWNELLVAVTKMEKMILNQEDFKLCEIAG